MIPETFITASDNVQSCLALSMAVAAHPGEDPTEFLKGIRQRYTAAEKPISLLSTQLSLVSEGTVGPFPGDWPQVWKSAHEAALGIAYMTMVTGSAAVLIDRPTFIVLSKRLQLERDKLYAMLPKVPGEWMRPADAARALGRKNRQDITKMKEAGLLESREVPNRTGKGRRTVVFVPESMRKT